MTDRELLELAAKAAGIKGLACGDGIQQHFKHRDGTHTYPLWNPLTDDGDALRLSVKLGLQVAPANGSKEDIPECYRHSSLMGRSIDGAAERHFEAPYAATRRAIVRAAAEIGRAMP